MLGSGIFLVDTAPKPHIAGVVTNAHGSNFFLASGGETVTITSVTSAEEGVQVFISQSGLVTQTTGTVTGSTVTFTMPANPAGATVGSGPSSQMSLWLANGPDGNSNTVTSLYYYPDVGIPLNEMWTTSYGYNPAATTTAMLLGVKGTSNLVPHDPANPPTSTASWSNGTLAVTNATGAPTGGVLDSNIILTLPNQITVSVRESDPGTGTGSLFFYSNNVSISATDVFYSAFVSSTELASVEFATYGSFNGADYATGSRSSPGNIITAYDGTAPLLTVGTTTWYNGGSPISGTSPSSSAVGVSNFIGAIKILGSGGSSAVQAQFNVLSIHNGIMTDTQVGYWNTWLDLF